MNSKKYVNFSNKKLAISQISVSKIQDQSISSMAIQLINPSKFSELLNEKYLHILAFVEPLLVNENLELIAGFNTFIVYKNCYKPSFKVNVKVVKEKKEVVSLISLYLASNLDQKKAMFQSIKINKKEYFRIISEAFPQVNNLKTLQTFFGLTNAQVRSSVIATSRFESAFKYTGSVNNE
tara:strand:+ start:836 stop:1375 length:540 start_codon:yes stop_codon:yes gene_type:complete